MSELGSPSCQKQAILSNWNSRAPDGANKLAKLVDAMRSYNYLWLEEGLLNAEWKSGKEEIPATAFFMVDYDKDGWKTSFRLQLLSI